LTGGRDIFVASVDFEAGKVLAPSSVIPQPYQGLIDSPRWSPDGKFLAYFTSKDGSAGNRLTALAIRSMETGKVRELRPDLISLNGSPYSRPRWSPDANSFFVAGTDRKGRYGIYRIDAQTGHSTPVVMNSGQDYPIARDVSPDGRMLVISRMAPNAVVVSVRDLQTGSERELVRRWRMGEVALSPDGRFVALTAFDERVRPSPLTSSLLVIPVEGGEPRVLLRVTSPAEWLGAFVAWSPDGKSLLFRKFIEGSTRGALSRIPVEGGVPRELGFHLEVGRSPHIHPDGRQVAFTTIGDPKYEVWTLENLLSALNMKK
jgi:Tol biopolymer transport system component